MAADIYRKQSVPELKAFLSERGVNVSSYRKESLVRSAEAASLIQLSPEEEEPEEEHLSNRLKRRTVVTKDNKSIIFPDVMTITKWNKSLAELPNIEMGDVMVYVMTTCMWTKVRLKCYKKDNSYQLFLQGHVDNVVISKMTNNHIYVKCTTVPETRLSEKPYITWILMDMDANIKSGGCTCVADDGTCKHCVALLFSLQAFGERHKDRGVETCTDTVCAWDKPRKTSNPVTIKHFSFTKGHDQSDARDDFVPISDKQHMSHDEIKNALYKAYKSHGSVLLHTMEPPYDEDDITDDANKIKTLGETLQIFKSHNDVYGIEDVIEYLCGVYDKTAVDQIEFQTRSQANSNLWFDHRKGRITASIMGSVLKCKLDSLSSDNYIVKRINGISNFPTIAATEYGKTMEHVALTQYLEEYLGKHTKATMSRAGLVVTCSTSHPFIAASPDSFMSCKCCGNGIFEVKCPYTYQQKYVLEIAKNNDYHITLEGGEMKLKRSSSWYTQIQTQRFCT